MKRFILLNVICFCMSMGLQAEAASQEAFLSEDTAYGNSVHEDSFYEDGFYKNAFYEDGDVVGFIGDSITHATYLSFSYVDVISLYYLSMFPQREVEFRNLATAGYKVSDVLNIYGLDPAFRDVNKVVIMLGTNEAILGVSPEKYISNMGKLVSRLLEDGLEGEDILILSPPICSQIESRLLKYMEMLEVKAMEWGVGYVDLHTPMAELAEEMQREDCGNTLTTDGIHPNAAGQVLLAYYVLQAQEGQLEEDALGVFAPNEETWTANDEIQDFYRGERGMCWTWRPRQLPVAVYGEAVQAYDVSSYFSDFFHETIRVEGLSEGMSYRVLMGEEELGIFTGQELLDGIIPVMSENHPQWTNIQQISDWSRQRHSNDVRYRNIWVEIMMQRAVYDPGTIQSAYARWRASDEELRSEMSVMAQDMTGMVYSVSILEEGYSAAELEQEKWEAKDQARREAKREALEQALERSRGETRQQVREVRRRAQSISE